MVWYPLNNVQKQAKLLLFCLEIHTDAWAIQSIREWLFQGHDNNTSGK